MSLTRKPAEPGGYTTFRRKRPRPRPDLSGGYGPAGTRRVRPESERFWTKVRQTDECWLWTGAKHPAGYGNFRRTNGTYISAHRYAYIEANGPITPGLMLDHLCRTPSCVRPSHLEEVTNRENVLRGNAPMVVVYRTRRCPRGHSFDEHPPYLARMPSGYVRQNCSVCQSERDRRRRWAKGLKRIPPGTRPALYERCNGHCEKCGVAMKISTMEVHHRKLRSQGGSWLPSNLLAVHANCHTRHSRSIHMNPADAYDHGWLVRQAFDPAETPVLLPEGRRVLLTDDYRYEASA